MNRAMTSLIIFWNRSARVIRNPGLWRLVWLLLVLRLALVMFTWQSVTTVLRR